MSGLHIRAGALETVLDLDSTPTLHIRERTHFHVGEGLLLPKSQERHIYYLCLSCDFGKSCSNLLQSVLHLLHPKERWCIAHIAEEGKVHLWGDTGRWCNPNTPSCRFSLTLGGSRLLRPGSAQTHWDQSINGGKVAKSHFYRLFKRKAEGIWCSSGSLANTRLDSLTEHLPF